MKPNETDSLAGEPIYQVIYCNIKNDIITGKLMPGQMLSSENTICKKYSASRMTVHKSLKMLEAEGYIYARPGKGYFVCMPSHNQYELYFQDETDNSVLCHISVVRAAEEVSESLHLPPKGKVIEIIRETVINQKTISCEYRYMPYDKGQPSIESEINFAIFPEMAAAKISPFAFHTHMEISATSATEKLVKRLSCPEGAPLLTVKRTLITTSGQCIAISIKYMLPEYNSLSADSGLQFKR